MSYITTSSQSSESDHVSVTLFESPPRSVRVAFNRGQSPREVAVVLKSGLSIQLGVANRPTRTAMSTTVTATGSNILNPSAMLADSLAEFSKAAYQAVSAVLCLCTCW